MGGGGGGVGLRHGLLVALHHPAHRLEEAHRLVAGAGRILEPADDGVAGGRGGHDEDQGEIQGRAVGQEGDVHGKGLAEVLHERHGIPAELGQLPLESRADRADAAERRHFLELPHEPRGIGLRQDVGLPQLDQFAGVAERAAGAFRQQEVLKDAGVDRNSCCSHALE